MRSRCEVLIRVPVAGLGRLVGATEEEYMLFVEVW
jgi:hypothetical protein